MNSVSNKPWYSLKKGDLIRNKNDGEYAVVISTYTKFFQDRSHWGSDVDYGVAARQSVFNGSLAVMSTSSNAQNATQLGDCMQVGDMVELSSAGRKAQQNYM